MLGVLDAVGDYLADLMALVVRATPGPFTITRGTDGRWNVASTYGGQQLAGVAREADAKLIARALPAVRSLASATAEVLALHHDDGDGGCTECGQPMDCRTRRAVSNELAPRAGSA